MQMNSGPDDSRKKHRDDDTKEDDSARIETATKEDAEDLRQPTQEEKTCTAIVKAAEPAIRVREKR